MSIAGRTLNNVSRLSVRPLTLPMRQPFITARGQKTVSRNLLVMIRLSDGTVGVGEASASLAWAAQTPAAMRACLQRLRPLLIGQPLRQAWRRLRDCWEAPWAQPAAISAAECALAGAEAQATRIALWRYLAQRLGTTVRRPRAVTTMLTISAWPTEVAARAARQAAVQGFRQFKVKVTGRDPEADLARLMAIHRTVPDATLLVDANQGFSPRGAIAFARAMMLLQLPVALFEQPVPQEDVEGMAWVTRESPVAVVADETVCRPADARRLIARRACRLINVKLAKSGLIGALEIIRIARRRRIPLMIGCMAESAVGLVPSVHLACGSGAFRYVDLDSHLLVRGPTTRSFRTDGPRLSVAE